MKWAIAIATLVLAACAGVRPQDLAAWEGQPVEVLEKHPVFLTMPIVKTVTADTEIRNYVNGRSIAGCSGNGFVTGSTLNYAAYNHVLLGRVHGLQHLLHQRRTCAALHAHRNRRREMLYRRSHAAEFCRPNKSLIRCRGKAPWNCRKSCS